MIKFGDRIQKEISDIIYEIMDQYKKDNHGAISYAPDYDEILREVNAHIDIETIFDSVYEKWHVSNPT